MAVAFAVTVAATEPIPEPSPSPTPARTPTPTRTPAPTYRTYVVQNGDTLSRIAQRFKTTVDELVRLNGLRDASVIRPGQQLLIP